MPADLNQIGDCQMKKQNSWGKTKETEKMWELRKIQ